MSPVYTKWANWEKSQEQMSYLGIDPINIEPERKTQPCEQNQQPLFDRETGSFTKENSKENFSEIIKKEY